MPGTGSNTYRLMIKAAGQSLLCGVLLVAWLVAAQAQTPLNAPANGNSLQDAGGLTGNGDHGGGLLNEGVQISKFEQPSLDVAVTMVFGVINHPDAPERPAFAWQEPDHGVADPPEPLTRKSRSTARPEEDDLVFRLISPAGSLVNTFSPQSPLVPESLDYSIMRERRDTFGAVPR